MLLSVQVITQKKPESNFQRTHKVVPERHKVVGSKNKKIKAVFALIFCQYVMSELLQSKLLFYGLSVLISSPCNLVLFYTITINCKLLHSIGVIGGFQNGTSNLGKL